MDTGLIHIYCGDGKGKTTAAVGLTDDSCAVLSLGALLCYLLETQKHSLR